MSDRVSVLIVGAGPVGLMMAIELARRGISFRIIDKNPERTLSSNATWVQTRTLELFDQMELVEEFLKIGHPCKVINLYISGKLLIDIPLSRIDSSYPFILMLPQSETEKLFIERLTELNVEVERSLEFIDLVQQSNQVISTIKHADGTLESITSDWLIGCDGANSKVRAACHIEFPGGDFPKQFIVADARIDSFNSTDEVHIFFDKGTVFAASPLAADNYRITANLDLEVPRQSFYGKEVIELVQERAKGAYHVNNISWISPFWMHGRIVDQMRHGSVFLAGDAAHVHPPVSGQGMNVGLQDANNLAWKLALVIKGNAKESLLNSYHRERYPVIRDMVNQTEKLTKKILDKTFLKQLRKFAQEILHGKTSLVKKINLKLSQTGIRYKNSPIIEYHELENSKSPKQGARAPDVMLTESTRLYDYLRNLQHNVLLFTGPNPSKKAIAKIKHAQETLDQDYSRLVKTYVVSPEEISKVNFIHDPNLSLHKRYRIDDAAIYVLRPDNYIAYSSNKINTAAVEKFFRSYLLCTSV